MASTLSTDPTAFATYNAASNAVQKRLADASFVSLSGPEEAILADIVVGLGEKNVCVLKLCLDAYAAPKQAALGYVEPGSIVGG